MRHSAILVMILILFTSYLWVDDLAGKKIEKRLPNLVVMRFYKGTTQEQIDSFIECLSEYGFKELYKMNVFTLFWFDEELVEDDDTFIEMINNESIVEGAFFHRIVSDAFEPINSSSTYNDKHWADKHIGLEESLEMSRLTVPNNFRPVVAVIDRGHFEFVNLLYSRYYNYNEDIPQTLQTLALDYLGTGNPHHFAYIPYHYGNRIDDDGNGAIDDYEKWVPIPNYINRETNPNKDKDTHGPIVIYELQRLFNYNFPANFNSGIASVRHFPIQCAEYGIPNNYWKLTPYATIEALQYVLKRRREFNADISTGIPFVAVNCSFKFIQDELSPLEIDAFSAYIDSLGVAGVLTVVAAGNDTINIDSTDFIPTNIDSDYIITVASHDNTNTLSYFSNWGHESVDLVAPGESMYYELNLDAFAQGQYPSLYGNYIPYADTGYVSGTSFAAPLVSGTLAMMYRVASDAFLSSYGSNHSALALYMKQMLLDGVIPEASLTDKVKSGGRLSAENAIINVRIPKEEATVDTIRTIQGTLDKRYIIKNATLTITNSSITAPLSPDGDTKYFGFIVYSGTLHLINTTIELGNGKIELLNGSTLILDNSIIDILDGNLIIRDGSLVELNNDSILSLSGASKITGYTSEVIEGYETIDNEFIITDRIRGDRVYINNSQLNLDNGSSITKGGSDKWEGLFFSNCTTASIISADISGIEKIEIYTSSVDFNDTSIHDINDITIKTSEITFESSEISGINRLISDDDSYLTLLNTLYHHNGTGIIAFDTEVAINNSDIYNNTADGISIKNRAHGFSLIDNTNIYNNTGSGLDIRHAMVDLKDSRIYNNGMYGYHNTSIVMGKVRGNTRISSNGPVEFQASSYGFPIFTPLQGLNPSIVDTTYTSKPEFILLSALSSYAGVIHVHDVDIDTQDNNRFLPSIDRFCFGCSYTNRTPADSLFIQAITYFDSNEFFLAMSDMKTIIQSYQGLEETKKSVASLPYLQSMVDGDFESLLVYLNLITDTKINYIKQATIALTTMFSKEYENAARLFQEIIDFAPSSLDRLVAELDQAYCYLKLVETGHRSILSEVTHRPQTLEEYLQITEDIYKRMQDLIDSEQQTPVSTVTPFTISNYPNPFNPETTIAFTLPKDGLVTIDVYNIKGQKVKSIVAGNFNAGNHQVAWNGDNDNHQKVGSGVYFYRMTTDGYSSVKKMLLMK